MIKNDGNYEMHLNGLMNSYNLLIKLFENCYEE